MANQIMRYFEFEHLPPKLQRYSKPFCVLAKQIDVTMKDSAEKTVCLRKLLEAKDACVRASLDESEPPEALQGQCNHYLNEVRCVGDKGHLGEHRYGASG